MVECLFCRGICEFEGVFGWFFVVKLWWFAWQTWYLNDHIFGVEKYATFSNFIFLAVMFRD
jgi:hypothetical protein